CIGPVHLAASKIDGTRDRPVQIAHEDTLPAAIKIGALDLRILAPVEDTSPSLAHSESTSHYRHLAVTRPAPCLVCSGGQSTPRRLQNWTLPNLSLHCRLRTTFLTIRRSGALVFNNGDEERYRPERRFASASRISLGKW